MQFDLLVRLQDRDYLNSVIIEKGVLWRYLGTHLSSIDYFIDTPFYMEFTYFGKAVHLNYKFEILKA